VIARDWRPDLRIGHRTEKCETENKNCHFSVSHFSVWSVWSGLNDDHGRRPGAQMFVNLPLRFWEKAIPKADRSPDTLIVSLISNHVIPELTPLAVSGTPLGYLIGMTTENRHNWSVAAMTA
jgi:hypothetical protein